MDKYDESVAVTLLCRCGTKSPLRDMAFADTPIGPSYLCDECAQGWELAHELHGKDRERDNLEAEVSLIFSGICGELVYSDYRPRYPAAARAVYQYWNQHIGIDPMPGCGPAPELSVWADVWNKVTNDE